MFLDIIGVEDQKAATVKEVCRTVCKSHNLDEKKLSAIVADNCSAMPTALSPFTLERICDQEDLLGDVDLQNEYIFVLNVNFDEDKDV